MNAAFAAHAIRFWAVIGIVLVFSSVPASARLPQPIQKRGVIEMIDHPTHTLRLRVKADGRVLMLVWTPRTQILNGTRKATLTDLTKGASVTVWYRHPVFGERFATKILIEAGLGRSLQPTQSRSTLGKP